MIDSNEIAKGSNFEVMTTSDAFKQQIFCNVELNGSYIEAVGFDMDFTLAQVAILTG